VFDFSTYSYQKDSAFLDALTYYGPTRRYYNYDQNKCLVPCHNYKTMVLATLNAIGCYRKICFRKRDSSQAYLTMCLLLKNGGNPDGRPYKRGDSCSECPDGFVCRRKQCFDNSSPVTLSPTPTTSIFTMLSPATHSLSPSTSISPKLSQTTNPHLPIPDYSAKLSSAAAVRTTKSPAPCTLITTEVFPVMIMNMLVFFLCLIG
uniref:SCP domain-containing protein n=1 Tax=Mesocestoides corti TaxID=53468 RepID=A0A5K3FES2_MESCO